MLRPTYIDNLPNNLVDLYSQAETDIIIDIARRLTTYDFFIPSAEHQFRKLQDMGLLYDEILKKLTATTGIAKEQLESLIKEAGAETLKHDDSIYRKAGKTPTPLDSNPAMQLTLAAGIKKTNSLFENLTRTTANTATKQFENALDRIYMQITSGAFDYNSSIRMVVKDLASKGVATVQYSSGHIDYMEVAVRRATVTGVNQTAAKLQEARADEMGSDLVETTAHAGARPEHQLWQGKIFSRSGKHPKYPDFVSSTGYGTGEGLCGWNCRHNFFPYFEGISEPAYNKAELEEMNAKNYTYNGQAMTEYEATQRQRHIERQIRKWKREYAGMEAVGMPTDESISKISAWQRTQKDFIKQTGLKRQTEREQIPEFGKSQAGKVSASIKNSASKSGKGSIIDNNKVGLKDNADQNFEKAFNKAVDHGKKTGNECLLWLDANGMEVVKVATGNKDSVAINQETIDYLMSAKENTVISLHNHPKSSAFSPEDINIACHFKAVKEMRVIGHDGTKYYLEIGEGDRPSMNEIRKEYEEAKNKTHDKYYKIFIETGDTAATWKEHSNEINEAIAKKFKWNYRREIE
ncbi:phage minor capsid protein [Anaerovorax odorimutans]|uniref:phage minor capsid protein n=1 Tax=Anaerovorax odorimutans TaxID=109327 RepID=UPI0006885B69|nr:phage minor capsid protein [Anaerovorax odorimutans]